MKYLLFFLLVVPFVSLGADPLPDPLPEPLWPMDSAHRYLTSNFMEYRGGRFHAGIDLKTNSREGYTVRAVEDGFISRVRCTPTAYGKVVYLAGVSGRTFVYAHLQRFNDEIDALVRQSQEESGRYRASMHLQEGQIRVRRGDVLGLSGQSGTGGPHLHFEVRDGAQRPLNPHAEGFVIDDQLAPVIHSLRAWPASGQSRILGQTGEFVLEAAEGGLAGDLGVLPVQGPVAFSARMVDAADVAGHKLEPWLIELKMDGDPVYLCRNEAFSFDQNALQRLEWTDRAVGPDRHVPREHWLHRRAANELAGREGGLWYLGADGAGLAPGLHHFELKVLDFFGNSTVVRWQVLVAAQSAPETKNLWRREPLGVRFKDDESLVLSPFFSLGDPAEKGYLVRDLVPGDDPVMEPTELWVEVLGPAETGLVRDQGLRSVSALVRYMAADWPVESSVPVVFPHPVGEGDGARRMGIYRLGQQGNWEHVEEVSSGSRPTFHLSDLGVHGVFEDFGKPILEAVKGPLLVEAANPLGVAGVKDRRWGTTALAVVDPGSGVDTGSIQADLDGRNLIVEPDPPRDRVLIHWPDDLAPGEHDFSLRVQDRVGNEAERIYRVLVGM